MRFANDGFSIKQADGGLVSFLNLKQLPRGGEPSFLTGTAQRFTSNGLIKEPIVAGTITQDTFSIAVDWPREGGVRRETYRGTIAPDGTITGQVVNADTDRSTKLTNVAPLK